MRRDALRQTRALIVAISSVFLGNAVDERVEFVISIPNGEPRVSEAQVRTNAPGISDSWVLNKSCSDSYISGARSFVFEFAPSPVPDGLAEVIQVFCYGERSEHSQEAQCSLTKEKVRFIWQKIALVEIIGEPVGKNLRQFMGEIENLYQRKFAVGAPQFSRIEIRDDEIQIKWGDCFCPERDFARWNKDEMRLEFFEKSISESCFST